MLHGKLKYLDDHVGVVEYDVYAVDSFDDFKFYLVNEDFSNYTNYMNAGLVYDKCEISVEPRGGKLASEEEKALYDRATKSPSMVYFEDRGSLIFNAYEDSEPSNNRRLDVKKTNKYKTNITNKIFCLRLSALVRYIQINGKKDYNMFVSEDNYFSPTRTVHLKNLGTVVYNMGLITGMSISSPYIELELTTISDDVFDVGVFKELKQKDKYGNILSTTPVENIGFKLDSELLGFEYVPVIKTEQLNIFGMFETIEEVIENNPDKNTTWILDRKYEIVNDENLEEVVQEFMNYDGYIAFDTETTDLKINFKSRTGEADQLVGVVLSKEIGSGYYFPLQHKRFKNLCGDDHWYFMEKYMKPILEQKRIICHNLKFDWKVAYIYDIVVNCVYDTMLAFGVTKRYEEESFSLSLKTLVKNILGLDMFDLGDFVTGSSFSDSNITFADLPYELVRRYAPADTDMTLSLFEYLERESILDKYGATTIFDMEVNFAKAVAYAEFYGYHINALKIPEMREQIEGGMEKHRNDMFAMVGREFNPNSPDQISKIMYDELGVETIGGSRSTNKEILRSLSRISTESGEPKYPFVVSLKNYRDNEGIYKNFLKRLHEFATEDGYIFSDTKQLGTDTGRTSAGGPNYQSYNDPVKRYVIPRSGFMHFDSDFSQIEYRVLASMAQQMNLMAEFQDPDLDYHTFQASRMFNVPYSAVSKALRAQSKGVNFGLPYGMGDSSLGTHVFGVRNRETQAKAADLRRKFFQGQERIEEFFERVRREGVSDGFTSTKFGRRRYYHRTRYSVSEIRRQAGNHVIQGTAADIYKIACNRLFNRIIDEGWLGKVLINVFVHDELLVEVHKSINPYYFFKAWREEFELSVDGFCKLYAGAGAGKSWYDAKKQDLPPQYIDEIIDSWYEGMPWDENTDKFLDDITRGYEDYKIRRVREYITDPENQGNIIKPNIYALLVELSGKIVDSLYDLDNPSEVIQGYNLLFEEPLIPEVKGKTKIKSLDDHIKVFCHFHGIDSSVLDILSPDVNVTTQDYQPKEEIEHEISFSDDSFSIGDLVELRGFYLDETMGVLHFMNRSIVYDGVPTDIINLLFSKGSFKAQGRYQLALFNPDDKSTTYYNAFMDETDYQFMIRLYNMLNATTMNFTQTLYSS